MKIAVYGGFGYVGKAIVEFLRTAYEVKIVDPPRGFPVINADDCDLAVVCVPTLQNPDGSADVSIVEDIIRAGDHGRYLIKSTVPPGTTARLAAETGRRIVFSPEYIGEGTYEVPWWKGVPHPTDIKKHDFHIFGGPPAETRVWVDIWSRVAGWVANYHQTDSTTAELTKYAENMFLATKKLFCSELFLTAQAFGVDYAQLRELWLLDQRIGPSMSLVWGERLAFGGKCLPKDSAALVHAAAAAGHYPEFFRAVIERNEDMAQRDRVGVL